VLIFRVTDPVRAEGSRNHDSKGILDAIAQAEVVVEIMKWKLDQIVHDLGGCNEALLKACKPRMKRYGVTVVDVALNSFSTAKTFNLMGVNLSPPPE
jgi:hypothetical protein